jgi:glyoxylase-like metal-dependent hydrolase (beta-lactamase superfamily II)
MTRAIAALAIGLALGATGAMSAGGQTKSPPAKVSLTRLDCGTSRGEWPIAAFSDTHAYDGKSKALTVSCYLIRHGDQAMLWDLGFPAATAEGASSPVVVRASIAAQLRELGIDPARVSRIGVSHYHDDHTGQAPDFPGATLMIGAADWAALTAKNIKPGFGAPNPAPVAHWITGGGKVDAVSGDRDVFGDGTVTMLDLPGHTPGHHALLVRLGSRNVLLSGDLAHFTENYVSNGVPAFNTNRADTLASLDRFKKIAENLKATVIIQHEPADVAKLPAFPRAAQ